MRYIIFSLMLLYVSGCATSSVAAKGCPALDSRASCMAAAKAERNMIEK